MVKIQTSNLSIQEQMWSWYGFNILKKKGLISKVFDSWIRDIKFNFCLYQKLIGVFWSYDKNYH